MSGFVAIFYARTLDHQSSNLTLTEMAATLGWTVLQPGESIRLDNNSQSIVISGITWSQPDLEVLDELASHDIRGMRVWLFNPDYVLPDTRILPGAPTMVTTPVLAEYSGTQLVSFLQGGGVIDRIRSLFPARSSS